MSPTARPRVWIARLIDGMRVGPLLAMTIGLVLVLAVVGIGLALLANGQVGRDRGLLLNQVGPAQRASLTLENALINQETGVRGYLITGQPGFLEPYRDGLESQARAYAALRAREQAIGPDVTAEVEGVRAHAQAWQREYVTPALARARRSAPRSIRADLEGKRLFDAIRASLARLQHALEREDAQTRAKLESATGNLQIFLILATALILGGVLGAGVLLRQTITRPLERLGSQARRVAGGEFSTPLQIASGPREIAAVGGEIDAMRKRIVDELASVEAAHTQLERQAAELRRSNVELEQFAYVASHDLQEPLRKIASFCQALQARYRGRLDERADQYIDFAVDGAKRMQTLINDLLAFSRAGGSAREREATELNDVVAEVQSALSGVLEDSGASVVVDELPAVLGDRTQLASLFQNLIANAVKFRGEEPPVVRIGALRQGDEWQLSCADNGIGIEPEYAERIFLIFQRLHSRDAYEGTGIGLALCRKIVEHHGGRIWLDTDHNGGACFRFTLPIVKDTKEAKQ
jgi:signal transduction histidine kinase